MSEKTVAQKLLLKGGQLLVVNPPPDYGVLLGALPPDVTLVQQANAPVDAIHVFVAHRQEMEDQLPRLKDLLKPHGMLWVSYHKGTSRVKTDINRDMIRAYAQTVGLQAVAMISINDDWCALRLKAV
jgi:hypothetical protein